MRQPGTKTAVTGAGGYIGSNLSEYLLAKGYTVNAHVHSTLTSSPLPKDINLVVEGDIADRKWHQSLLKEVDIVFHLVSNFRSAKGKPESYYKTNLEGTKAIFHSAVEAGVKRFVHCSTIGVLGDVKKTPADEESTFNPGDLYQKTKTEAELWIRDQIDKYQIEIVVVRPCSVYGPGDLRMLKMFKMLQNGKFFMLGSGNSNFHSIYIDDLVDGFELCATKPQAVGEVFILGESQYRPLKGYIATAAATLGVAPPKLKLPFWPIYWLSAVIEIIGILLHIEPPLHRRRVRFFKNNRAFDTSKAREQLGFSTQISLEEGMQRTVSWYRENKLL